MDILQGKKLILGSQSPRRKELLGMLGIPFTIETETSFREDPSPSLPHGEVPARMSEGKSLGFHRELAEDEILLTADTMVLCGEEILGKPRDEADAARMLRLLSGRAHEVVTAVTLRDRHRMKTFSVSTRVHFADLSEEEIQYYITHAHPLDKAGAYGIQEWIGYIGIRAIEGSYFNVVGFPTHRFYQELKAFSAGR